MAEKLKGRVAVVTGSGRGIGRAEALALATEGTRVVVNDPGVDKDGTGFTKGPADEVVEEIRGMGGQAVACYDSVTTWEGGERIIQTAIDAFGRLDILVNNAGILRERMIFNMLEEEWDTVLKVNLYGHFHCTRPACVWFRQQRSGRIINTSSAAGLGNMGQANYSAAKEGIVGFTRTVARDMGKYGVTCNALRPRAGTRLTLSPELKAALERARASGVASAALPEIPDYESLLPEDVAPLVVYLATDEAANINGCVFSVGGGQISLFPEPTPIKTLYKEGRWSVEELCNIVPQTLAAGLVNPSPPQPTK